jgi:hypothetical protein
MDIKLKKEIANLLFELSTKSISSVIKMCLKNFARHGILVYNPF